MKHSTLSLILMITAYMLYNSSLDSWAVFGLLMMVFVGIFGYLIGYMARYEAFRAWLNRYF
ncbi:MAG: hypothetical protein KA253_04160 [Campylobacteraceae bacterium]|nr:hypothetical protein [Campylobacteraceae bacterium]